MIVNERTRRALAIRREARELTKLGFRMHETDWEIHRGGRYREVILEVKISVCGKYVWTRCGERP